jgi:hypothetical protein
LARFVSLKDLAGIPWIVTAMVLDEDFDVRVCVNYICTITDSVCVIANYLSYIVENCTKLFQAKPHEVNLRFVELLNFIQIVLIGGINLINK